MSVRIWQVKICSHFVFMFPLLYFTPNHNRSNIPIFIWKESARALHQFKVYLMYCDILWVCICIWKSVRLIFSIWPYIIWCLALWGLFYWNPRSSNDEWHIWWHDPIESCHHPRGTLSPYIDRSQYQYKLFIYPFQSLTGI